jgi:hypothetical protein
MEARTRRWLAFLGGCVVGIGLGGLTNDAISDVNWFVRNGQPGTGGAPTMWGACLIIGAGLGAALAALIPNDRKLD